MKPLPKDFLTTALRDTFKAMGFILLFSLASNLLVLGLPIYSLQILDRVVSTGRMQTLVMLTIVVMGMFVFLGLFTVVRSFAFIKIGEWLDKKTARRLLSNSLSAAALRPGVSGGQNVRDLNTIRSFLTGGGMIALVDMPWSLVFLAVVFMISSTLGLVALAGGIILMLLALLNEYAMRDPLNEANEIQVRNFNYIESSARNAEVIEAMGMMDAIVRRWDTQNQEVIALQSIASGRSAAISSVAKTLRLFLQVAIMGVGGYLVLGHAMSMGGIIAASILTGRALAPFEQAIATWSSLRGTIKAYERLKKVIEKNPERAKAMSLPVPQGHLTFDKVFYVPPGSGKPVLKGINFTIRAGDAVGVVGPSGAGKSTMLKLMVGVWPSSAGVVRLDGADVYTWNREEFGRYIGYLPQDVELFEGSVKQNIARMDPDAPAETVVRAAKLAGVHDLILHLAEGYDTNIGVAGSSLSAGQRQRIALARAFYGDPKLLVLDEPNSNLDEAGERSLLAAMQNAKTLGMTTIVVSHRPSLLTHVDNLMVMQDGLVADFGLTKEIMAKYTRASQQQQQPVQNLDRQKTQPQLQGQNQAIKPSPNQQQPGKKPIQPWQEEEIHDVEHEQARPA